MQPQNPMFHGIMRKQVGALFPKGLGMLGWKWQVTYDRHHQALASHPVMSQYQVRL